jgi:hypothetical protein
LTIKILRYIFLEELSQKDLTVMELYNKVKKHVENIQEYIEILDCLFALKKIVLLEDTLHYVKTN